MTAARGGEGRSLAPRTPVALGELLEVPEIRARYFAHITRPVSDRWIAAQMPMDKRVRVGKGFAWWTLDIEAALAAMRGAA